MALRRVLTGDAFFAKIEPYRAIWAIALPPDYASIASRVGTEDVSHKMLHERTRRRARVVRQLLGRERVQRLPKPRLRARSGDDPRKRLSRVASDAELGEDDDVERRRRAAGGVLLTPTDHRDPVKVTIEDANRLADALRARDPRLRDVPFGFWDGPRASRAFAKTSSWTTTRTNPPRVASPSLGSKPSSTRPRARSIPSGDARIVDVFRVSELSSSERRTRALKYLLAGQFNV